MEKPTLESPLIPSSDRSFILSDVEKDRRWEVYLAEVKRQLWLGGPLIVSSLLQKILQVISVMFVGHLGELALSGASMATSFAGVTGFSLMVLQFLSLRTYYIFLTHIVFCLLM